MGFGGQSIPEQCGRPRECLGFCVDSRLFVGQGTGICSFVGHLLSLSAPLPPLAILHHGLTSKFRRTSLCWSDWVCGLGVVEVRP
jgi:hypothetical protein